MSGRAAWTNSARQLTANGIRWSIHNHRKWKELAKEAAEKYKADKSFGPIIIVGHSLGADAAVLMARGDRRGRRAGPPDRHLRRRRAAE